MIDQKKITQKKLQKRINQMTDHWPIGKFAGLQIDDIPSWYLKWVAENFKEETVENKALCMAADKEYQDREKNNCHF